MEAKIPFSCGTEAESWREHNCDLCIKAARSKGDGTWTKGRCKSELEIALGFVGSEDFSAKTLERCSHAKCPDFADHYPKRKRKKETVDIESALF